MLHGLVGKTVTPDSTICWHCPEVDGVTGVVVAEVDEKVYADGGIAEASVTVTFYPPNVPYEMDIDFVRDRISRLVGNS